MMKNFVVFIMLIFVLSGCYDCPSYLKGVIVPFHSRGIVVNKYYDSLNHMGRSLNISDKNGHTKLIIFPAEPEIDSSDFWKYVQIGDSIMKKQGNQEFKVKRNDSIKTFNLTCH
jgi:hypothetical protein